MTPKRMKHPEHGFTHVYDAGQEEQIRAHGWVNADDDLPETEQEAPAPEPVKRRITRKTKS